MTESQGTGFQFDLPHMMAAGAVAVSIVGGGYSGLTAQSTKSDVDELRNLVVQQAAVVANQKNVMEEVADFRRRIERLERRLENVKPPENR